MTINKPYVGELPDFTIKDNGPVSKAFIEKGIHRFHKAIAFVKAIPYGRNSSKSNLITVLDENTGTCSSKHALLKVLLDEHEVNGIHLVLGTYKMMESNTKGVGKILDDSGLEYIPEAHNYLEYRGVRYDFTFPEAPTENSPFAYLLEEIRIQPGQILSFKVDYHKEFLQKWLNSTNLKDKFDVDKVWKLREACIKAISSKN